MNIASTKISLPSPRISTETVPARGRESQEGPRDSFLQNIGQFVEGAIPLYGARPMLSREAMDNYSPGEGAAMFMGQMGGCYFGLLAGMMHASQGLQAAAVGYGIAGIGLLASGIANSHANHAAFR